MKNNELKLDDPIYLKPKYIPSRGEATDIAFADKRIETEYKTMKTVLRNIFLKARVDKNAVKLRGAEVTGKKILVPLYVNSRILLVPVKMRKPAVRGDVSYGYVNYFAIDEIGEDDLHCSIRFFNGLTLQVLGSGASIRKACGDALMVSKADCFVSNGGIVNNSHKYFYGDGENPATKADVEELKREMWIIREVLGI
ncbi:MAG: hypothetical protein JJE29_01410 [Peptostreptococcaceae bacterium]|nr:hypothetical protein [Peptostreptococcaceae bacterium]